MMPTHPHAHIHREAARPWPPPSLFLGAHPSLVGVYPSGFFTSSISTCEQDEDAFLLGPRGDRPCLYPALVSRHTCGKVREWWLVWQEGYGEGCLYFSVEKEGHSTMARAVRLKSNPRDPHTWAPHILTTLLHIKHTQASAKTVRRGGGRQQQKPWRAVCDGRERTSSCVSNGRPGHHPGSQAMGAVGLRHGGPEPDVGRL